MMFPRTDQVKVEELPISESYIAHFVAQHQYARDYADHISFTLPYITPVAGGDNPTGDGAYVHVFKDEFYGDDGYIPTLLLTDNFSDETFPADGLFTSAIVCLDGLDKDIPNADGTTTKKQGNIVSCQTKEQTFKYVLTYGTLFPQNPVNHNLYRTRLQNNHILWEKALENRTKGDPDCGIISLENEEGVIYSAHTKGRIFPKAIYDLYSQYADNTLNFQPVFCITPVNSPYVTDGLIYHLDSMMNEKNDSGAPTHSNVTTNGWNNIVSQQDNIPIHSTDDSSSWHPDDEIPLAFQKETYLALPINGANTLKNEFTISIIANLDTYDLESITSEAPLFSTNTGSHPYVLAMYKSGYLIISVYQSEDVKIGEIKAPIPRNIVSISYVLGSRFHHLFFNESLSVTQTFKDNQFLAPIESPTLYIGASPNNTTNKINADIYNIKVYNRALNKDEIQTNLKTDKKRYKF